MVVSHDAGVIAPRWRLQGWVQQHPLGGFVLLTFVLSWLAFVAAALGAGPALVVLGAFGPAAAAALVTRWTGGSVRAWLRPLGKWRVPVRFYVYALGVPPALVALTNLELAALGHAVAVGSVVRAVPGYVGTLVLVALLGGGQEEPGWRGFALERYQAGHRPLAAALLLGLVWGAWHLPVYGLGGFVGPMLFVVFYSWLYNRTGSVLLCVLLHAGFNTAIGYLDLGTASGTVWLVFLVTAAAGAAALALLTRGRLGAPAAGGSLPVTPSEG